MNRSRNQGGDGKADNLWPSVKSVDKDRQDLSPAWRGKHFRAGDGGDELWGGEAENGWRLGKKRGKPYYLEKSVAITEFSR